MKGSLMPICEITVEELQTDYDWCEVFGEGDGGNCDGHIDGIADCPPNPVSRAMVVEIVAAVNGERDETDWIGVFRLQDGRYLAAEGSCDYTGWDCRAANHLAVAKTLDDILAYGLTPEQRQRLGV
jgi:hypothetical protein